MKIAVYALCINERPLINRFMAAAQGADLVFVADAGSQDGSTELLRALGAVTRPIALRPWRMDDARNVALALMPDDIDLCIALDLDMALLPGWRGALEAEWSPAKGLGVGPVIVGTDPVTQRLETRVHARHGARWRGPCDEYLVLDRSDRQVGRLQTPILQAPPGERGRPGALLQLRALGVEEDPTDARLSHRYGRSLRQAGCNAEALAELERCLGLPGLSTEDRNPTLRLIGLCHFALGDAAQGLAWLNRAVDEEPALPGAWIDLAAAHYQQHAWNACLRACVKTMATPQPLVAYDLLSQTGAMPEDMAAVSAWRMGRRSEGLDFARRAVARAPGNARLVANLEMMQAATANST